MDQLISVTKDGQTLEVHPLTLKAHIVAGWKVVEAKVSKAAEKVVAEVEAEIEAEKKNPKKSG